MAEWTQEHIDVLKTIAVNNGTYSDAQRIMRRPKSSIAYMAARLSLSLKSAAQEIDMDAFKKFLKEKGK